MIDAAIIPIPEGFTNDEVEHIPELARRDPARCMRLIDESMKSQVRSSRLRWIAQAQMVYFVEETKLWKYHEAGFNTIFAWAMQPEIDLHASTVSDMLAIVRYAPEVKEQCDIDLFKLIEDIGNTKIRQIIPAMRKANRSNTMAEELTPMLDEIQAASFRDILKMVSPGGQRLGWDPEAVYQEVNGKYSLTFRDLNFDELELLATKTSLKRWFNSDGYRIDPPINALALPSGEDDPEED